MKISTNFAALVLLMLAGSLAGQSQTRLYEIIACKNYVNYGKSN